MHLRNIKRLILCFFTVGCLVYCTDISAQNKDSIFVVNAEWNLDTLSSGVILKQLSVTNNQLFNSNQHISILEMDPQQAKLSFNIAAGKQLTKTSELCKNNQAFAAINGTFFFMKSGISTDYIRINHANIAQNVPKDGKRKSYKNGLVAIDSSKFEIVLPDDNLNFEDQLPHPCIMTAGPMLLYDYNQLSYIQNSFTLSRHNRTAVASMPDGKIIWVVVDGRFKQAAGMTLKELGDMMRWLGAEDALNLDGGGSSTLFINLPNYGIINYPSDNGLFDKNGERKVANALLLNIID